MVEYLEALNATHAQNLSNVVSILFAISLNIYIYTTLWHQFLSYEMKFNLLNRDTVSACIGVTHHISFHCHFHTKYTLFQIKFLKKPIHVESTWRNEKRSPSTISLEIFTGNTSIFFLIALEWIQTKTLFCFTFFSLLNSLNLASKHFGEKTKFPQSVYANLDAKIMKYLK